MALALSVVVGHARDTHAFSGWIVFFERNSADMSEQARSTLRELVAGFNHVYADRNCPVGVYVLGHIDAAESASGQDDLSVRRAEAVANELNQLGLRAAWMTVRGASFSEPMVPTAPGVGEPVNRRVRVRDEYRRADGDVECRVRDLSTWSSAGNPDYWCYVRLPTGAQCPAEFGYIGDPPSFLSK